jgi:hypothetical protein
MVKGVTECGTKNSAIGKELFLIGLAPRNIFLVYAIITHKSPLVVVSCKPDLENIVEALVFKDLLLG